MTQNTKTAAADQDPQSGPGPLLSKPKLRRTVVASALRYHLFKPRAPAHPLVLAAYAMWQDQWLNTLREVAGTSRLFSDEFTRQDEIGALFLDGHCVAVTALRWIDRSTIIGREDSYFEPWPPHAFTSVGNGLVGISSNTIVHPEWRGADVKLSEDGANAALRIPLAILALTQRRFTESRVSLIVGIARNDRAMNQIGAALGGWKVGQILVHGAESDLMCLPRTSPPAEGAIVDWLWTHRIESDASA